MSVAAAGGDVTAVVQARSGSSRLPGKVLRVLGDATVLAHVVHRVARCRTVARVVVATTTEPEDDAVADEAARAGARVTRGSTDDVLARFIQAFDEHGGTVGVRITSDCPFLDPTLVDDGVSYLLERRPPPDYVSNTLHRSYPRGYDFEVFRVEALRAAAREAASAGDREHVTPFLYRHPERFRLASLERPDPSETAEWRLTLDTGEDWEVIRAIFGRLSPGNPTFGLADVERLLLGEPQLLAANRHVRQKPH